MKHCEYQQIDPQALSTPTPTPTPTPPPPPCAGKKIKRTRRKWEVFPGKNRFYCDGRIIVARQSGVLPLTLGLILVTSVLFFIFDCPFLVIHLTTCIPVIGGVLFVLVMVSLLQTSFTDPGILPRATPDEAADIERQIDNSSSGSYRPPPRTREVLINQQLVKLKYCFTCKMFRPPRTSHCSLCDNCVERFDHHCPWVGNCVGRRNYRFFYMFIVSLSFLTAFIFGCVTTHLALRSQGGNGLVFALQESPASALELVVCFFSVWSILGLSGFHTYLVASNLTTNEDIKGSWSGNGGVQNPVNPYSYNNIFTNCCVVLCGPMPPSLIDRRGFIPTEDTPTAAPPEEELPQFAAKNDTSLADEELVRGKCTQGAMELLEMAALHPGQVEATPSGKPVPPPVCLWGTASRFSPGPAVALHLGQVGATPLASALSHCTDPRPPSLGKTRATPRGSLACTIHFRFRWNSQAVSAGGSPCEPEVCVLLADGGVAVACGVDISREELHNWPPKCRNKDIVIFRLQHKHKHADFEFFILSWCCGPRFVKLTLCNSPNANPARRWHSLLPAGPNLCSWVSFLRQ